MGGYQYQVACIFYFSFCDNYIFCTILIYNFLIPSFPKLIYIGFQIQKLPDLCKSNLHKFDFLKYFACQNFLYNRLYNLIYNVILKF